MYIWFICARRGTWNGVRMYNTKYIGRCVIRLEERTLWVYLWSWRRDKAAALIQELLALHLDAISGYCIWMIESICMISFFQFFSTCFFWIDNRYKFVRIENSVGCWIFDEVILCAISRYKLIQVRGNEIHKIFTANEIISETCTKIDEFPRKKNVARAQTSSARIKVLCAIWRFCHESSVIAFNRFADGLDASEFVWYQIRFSWNMSSCKSQMTSW